MIISDFAAASVLIAMGAVLGKVNHIQLCMMAVIQVVLQQVNEWIGLHKYHVCRLSLFITE
jgi:ammonium transporter Rh